MRNDRVKFIKKMLVAFPVILSLLAVILSIITMIQVSDINRRLRSVSLNTYVEQTVVSNNYIMGRSTSAKTGAGDSAVTFGSSRIEAADPAEDGAIKVYLTFDDGPS